MMNFITNRPTAISFFFNVKLKVSRKAVLLLEKKYAVLRWLWRTLYRPRPNLCFLAYVIKLIFELPLPKITTMSYPATQQTFFVGINRSFSSCVKSVDSVKKSVYVTLSSPLKILKTSIKSPRNLRVSNVVSPNILSILIAYTSVFDHKPCSSFLNFFNHIYIFL